MEVEGAIRLGSKGEEAGAGNMSTWQWKVVLPTPWRLHEGYVQVTLFRYRHSQLFYGSSNSCVMNFAFLKS